jgi:hypothetical protein
MLSVRKAALGVLVALAGCAQIEVRDAEVAPGGTVTTENHTTNLLTAWIPRVSPGNRPGIDHWTRIRVIAPEGATECRSGSLFSRGGPQAEGKPDAERAVMLTSREGDRDAHFVCDTPNGAVRRSVNASVYTMPIPPNVPADKMWLYKGNRSWHVLPPLVHMDLKDAQADARWAAIGAELCPVISERASGFVCKPGMLEKFKAADLGETP